MITETSFIAMSPAMHLLKTEAIDRLDSVVNDLPKYKKQLQNLIVRFTIDEMLDLMNTIHRDKEFKESIYYQRYSEYFDEIEELIWSTPPQTPTWGETPHTPHLG
jgi:hypothetical protein